MSRTLLRCVRQSRARSASLKTRAIASSARGFSRARNSRTSSSPSVARKGEIELRVADETARCGESVEIVDRLRRSRRRRDGRGASGRRASADWRARMRSDARDFILQRPGAQLSPAASRRDERDRRRRRARRLAAAKPPSKSAKAGPVSTSTSAMSCTCTCASARATCALKASCAGALSPARSSAWPPAWREGAAQIVARSTIRRARRGR